MPESNNRMVLSLVVSQACNIRCRFCYQKNFGPERLSDELLYEKLAPLYPKVAFLPIVGGELTVIPGMKEYISWVKKNHPHITILIGTNGVEFNDDWIALADECGLLVNYSLNASSAQAYGDVLVSGSPAKTYAKIRGNLEKLARRQEACGKHLVNNISMVVDERTRGDLEPFVRLAMAAGLNVILRFDVSADVALGEAVMAAERDAYRLSFYCQDHIAVKLWHNPSFQREEEIYAQLARNDQEGKRAFLDSLDGKPRRAADKKIVTLFDYCAKDAAGNCSVPGNCLAIELDGAACPCFNLPSFLLGNLYHDSVETILSCDRLKTLTDEISRGIYTHCFSRCPLNANPCRA